MNLTGDCEASATGSAREEQNRCPQQQHGTGRDYEQRNVEHEVHHALVAVDGGIAETRPQGLGNDLGLGLELLRHGCRDRRELHLFREQAPLCLHLFNLPVHVAELRFYFKDIRELSRALAQEVGQTLLGVARGARSGT